jgi:hypothetical protein
MVTRSFDGSQIRNTLHNNVAKYADAGVRFLFTTVSPRVAAMATEFIRRTNGM